MTSAILPDGAIAASFTFHSLQYLDPDGSNWPVQAQGDEDLAIVVLEPDGTFRWGTSFGGPDADRGGYLAQLPDGGIVAAGTISDPSAPLPFPATHPFVTRLDSSGKTIWVREWGGDMFGSAGRAAVAADGTIYVRHVFDVWLGETADVDLDPGPDVFVETIHGTGAFVTSLDASGGFRWALAASHIHRIQVDADGTLLLVGWCSQGGDVQLGSEKRNCPGGPFVSRLNADGKHFGTSERVVAPNTTWFYVDLYSTASNQLLVLGQFDNPDSGINPFSGPVELPSTSGSFLASTFLKPR